MKRTIQMSAILFGCLFAGYVLRAEAAEMTSTSASAQVQSAGDGCDENSADYWTLFSAATSAQ